MRDYFGFDVTFVQNVTDVDDKVPNPARIGGGGAAMLILAIRLS